MDERVRELERRWRESGAWADRLAVLHAQRRAGALWEVESGLVDALDNGLTLEKLTLLAYFCVPAAGRLLGPELVALASYAGDIGAVRVVLGEPTEWADELAWARGLEVWNRSAVPAVCAVTRAALDAFAAEQRPADEESTWDVERRQGIAFVERLLDEVERGRIRRHRRPSFSHWFDDADRFGALEDCAAAILMLVQGGPEERATARSRWAVACPRVARKSLAQLLALAAPRLVALGPST